MHVCIRFLDIQLISAPNAFLPRLVQDAIDRNNAHKNKSRVATVLELCSKAKSVEAMNSSVVEQLRHVTSSPPAHATAATANISESGGASENGGASGCGSSFGTRGGVSGSKRKEPPTACESPNETTAFRVPRTAPAVYRQVASA